MFKQIPPITKNLLIINVIIFMMQLVAEQRQINLTEWLGLHFFLADDFNPLQLVTYMFLHGSFSHLLFNMFSLWMFGGIIERTMGFKRFLIYFFVCGIGAGICQEFWQLGEYYLRGFNQFEYANLNGLLIPISQLLNNWTTIGASGACYGVLLAFGMTYPNERIMLLIPPIPMKAKYFVVGYAVIELLSLIVTESNIAHTAHLGGMLFGLLLILYWRKSDRKRVNQFTGWNNWQPSQPKESMLQKGKRFFQDLFQGKAKMHIKKGGQSSKSTTADAEGKSNSSQPPTAEQERINQILEKIRRSGYESLTADEKRELFNNSRR